MKIVMLMCLLGMVVGHDDDWWNPTQKFDKWAEWKALEVCYGAPAMEQFHIKHKKALRKCSGMVAPEVELYANMRPYRMVHAMLEGMKEKNNMDMYQMMNQMSKSSSSNAQIHVVPVQQNDNMMMKMYKMMMMKKMMDKMVNGNDNYDMNKRYNNDDNDMSGFQKFFNMYENNQYESQPQRKSHKGQRYNKRDASLLDLGDRLVDKLELAQQKNEDKAGNISCYLQEFGYIDQDNNLDLQGMLAEWDSYDWGENQWLKEKSKQGVQDCYDMTMAMPEQILERYGDVKQWQIKKMMMCLDMHKKMECMCNDAKEMLEKHFKPLPELVQETGMSEMQLLKMTNMLIEDSMDF